MKCNILGRKLRCKMEKLGRKWKSWDENGKVGTKMEKLGRKIHNVW